MDKLSKKIKKLERDYEVALKEKRPIRAARIMKQYESIERKIKRTPIEIRP